VKDLRIGVDIVEIGRIEHALRRHGDRFIERVFTPSEAAYCRAKQSAGSWAARFAAKEALGKALRVVDRVPNWTDVEVVMDSRGRPSLRLGGLAAELARGARMEVSLSHTHRYAVAMVALIED
jgi:holo-[acyl-carrier protein] synthase